MTVERGTEPVRRTMAERVAEEVADANRQTSPYYAFGLQCAEAGFRRGIEAAAQAVEAEIARWQCDNGGTALDAYCGASLEAIQRRIRALPDEKGE